MRLLMIYAVALMLLVGCQMIPTQGSETEQALCRAWQESLPSRSRQDTATTIEDVGRAIAVHEAVCN